MSYSVSLDSIGSKKEKERTLNVFLCQSRLYRMTNERERTLNVFFCQSRLYRMKKEKERTLNVFCVSLNCIGWKRKRREH